MVKWKETGSDRSFMILNYIILISAALITFLPFYYVICVSLSDSTRFLREGVLLWPVGFSLKSYKVILISSSFWTAIKNSVIITVGGTFTGIILTMFAAFAISRRNLVGRKFIIGFMILTMYFSGGIIPFYILILKLGMYNSLLALIIPGVVSTYFIIIARAFVDTLPTELYESAYIDGANDIRILFSIIMPLCKPVIAVITLYYAVRFWNTYLAGVMFLRDPDKYPIQVYLANVIMKFQRVKEARLTSVDDTSFYAISIQLKYTLILMGIFPIIMMYPAIQKYLVKGMMIGSLKG